MEKEEKVIIVENLSKEFGRRTILNNLNFIIEKGKLTLFLGKNGAGKTTTIRTMLGFLLPDKGKVTINENRIGYIQQEPEFFTYILGEEILKITADVFRINDYWDKVLQIAEKLEFDIKLLKRDTNKFSPGEKKKLAYIQSMITEPDLLIVDEPFSSLDPVGIKSVKDILIRFAEEGKTVFISSHLLFETEKISDNVIIIHNGNIMLDSKWDRESGLEQLFLKTIKDA
jgi:ABC-2 type transport system ATP-binding protein